MKKYYSILAAILASGLAQGAETAYTTPVGYVTQAISNGFNFVGNTLHGPVIAAGKLETVASNSVSDTDVNFTNVLTSGVTYILEIDNGSGIIQQISSWSGSDLTTPGNLTGDVAVGASYKLREIANLESVFGATATQLTHGSFGEVGADQIWIFNGVGYNKYYFDDLAPDGFGANWVQFEPVAQNIMDPSIVSLSYADSFLIVSEVPKNIVLSGEVKTIATELNLDAGFNFVSCVAPSGATLASAYGADGSGLPVHGSFGEVGADQVWIFNGTGYNKYYFDDLAPDGFGANWVQFEPVSQNVLDPASVGLPTGYLLVVEAPKDVKQAVPTNYSSL